MYKTAIICAMALLLPLSSQAKSLDNQQKEEVKQLVRETLMDHPEILIEVITELRKKEQQQQAQAQSSALKAHYQELFHDSADPFAGPKNAKVSLVYFGDMNCGFCKKQDPILSEIIKKYKDVRIIYKDLPILRQSSREAAALALAAYNQAPDTYFSLHKRLMSQSSPLDSATIAEAVKKEGLDIEKLKKAISPEIDKQLDDNLRLAQNLGINGTPALVFQDTVMGGFTEQSVLAAAIEKRLETGK